MDVSYNEYLNTSISQELHQRDLDLLARRRAFAFGLKRKWKAWLPTPLANKIRSLPFLFKAIHGKMS